MLHRVQATPPSLKLRALRNTSLLKTPTRDSVVLLDTASSTKSSTPTAKKVKITRNGTHYAFKLFLAGDASIASLPPEIMLHIFSYLNVRDLGRAGTVCSYWYSLARDNQLWCALYRRVWGDYYEGLASSPRTMDYFMLFRAQTDVVRTQSSVDIEVEQASEYSYYASLPSPSPIRQRERPVPISPILRTAEPPIFPASPFSTKPHRRISAKFGSEKENEPASNNTTSKRPKKKRSTTKRASVTQQEMLQKQREYFARLDREQLLVIEN